MRKLCSAHRTQRPLHVGFSNIRELRLILAVCIFCAGCDPVWNLRHKVVRRRSKPLRLLANLPRPDWVTLALRMVGRG